MEMITEWWDKNSDTYIDKGIEILTALLILVVGLWVITNELSKFSKMY